LSDHGRGFDPCGSEVGVVPVAGVRVENRIFINGDYQGDLMPSEPTPDCPVAFGYKQIWLAVRDAEPQLVADTIGLIDTRASTWKEGIERAYEQGYDRERRKYRKWQEIFVSPPVLGWTLAVGGIGALPEPGIPER
jgi:hypothetical protein